MDTTYLHYPDNGQFIHRYPGIRILLVSGKINKIHQNVAKCFVISRKIDSLSISIQISMDTWTHGYMDGWISHIV